MKNKIWDFIKILSILLINKKISNCDTKKSPSIHLLSIQLFSIYHHLTANQSHNLKYVPIFSVNNSCNHSRCDCFLSFRKINARYVYSVRERERERTSEFDGKRHMNDWEREQEVEKEGEWEQKL